MKTYKQALEYLYSFIPEKRNLYTGENGIKRTKYLLHLLNNPQEKIKVIHIAGTSGKGSTAYLTSRLLSDYGFKVGLQVSPHLVDLRERFQIYTNQNLVDSVTHEQHFPLRGSAKIPQSASRGNPSHFVTPTKFTNNYPKEIFVKRLNEIIPDIEKAKITPWGKLTFFEICVCLAFYIFYKEQVDYAIMETGLGGLYDGTNVVKNPKKLAVITKIGFDHQSVLGYTLSAIAAQKSGIIQTGNTVITVQQKQTIMNVLYSRCNVKKSALKVIKKGMNFQNISISKSGTIFDFKYKNYSCKKLHLGLIGEHQIENASLALSVMYELSKRDHFEMNESKIRLSLQSARFSGRGEIYSTKHKDIIIDGAHNPQKMKAFISTLTYLYPNQKFDFLISFSEGKNHIPIIRRMLKEIVLIAHSITITSFTLEGDDMLHSSIPSSRIIKILKELHYKNYSIKFVDKNFIKTLLNKKGNSLVITGSLYLIGSIYKDLKNAILHSL